MLIARSTDELREWVEAYRLLVERWRDDPVRYMRHRLGLKPTWQQVKILEAVAPESAKVTARAGHGIGKSSATAGLMWWFLETRENSRVPCTAPTSAQLKDILWSELSKWMRKSDKLWDREGYHPALKLSNLFRMTGDRVMEASHNSREWFAVARTSGRDNPDALQGFHASDVEVSEDGTGLITTDETEEGKILFVVDEASGVFEKVFEVAEGALSSHGARLLMIGNPTKTSGFFARSHREDRAHFTPLHFRSSESPLVDPAYRQRLVDRWGEGSNIVRVRADGEFPTAEDDVLIALEVAEACLMMEPYQEIESTETRIGVDVARYGNDRSAIVARKGRNTLDGKILTKSSTTTVANAVRAFHKKHGGLIFVDTIGLGAGVYDQLHDDKYPVFEVNVAQSSPPRLPGEEVDCALLRDWLWVAGARHLEHERPSFVGLQANIAQQLVGELANTRYTIDRLGRLKVESKDEMKRRLGFSPDIADAWLNTFAKRPRRKVASRGRRQFA